MTFSPSDALSTRSGTPYSEFSSDSDTVLDLQGRSVVASSERGCIRLSARQLKVSTAIFAVLATFAIVLRESGPYLQDTSLVGSNRNLRPINDGADLLMKSVIIISIAACISCLVALSRR